MSSLTFKVIKILSRLSRIDLRHIQTEIATNLADQAGKDGINLRSYGIGNYGSVYDTGEKYLIENILTRNLQKQPIIVDVGANIGSEKQYANLIRESFPKAKVFAFEPNPAAFEELQKYCPTSKYQINEKIALGSKNTTVTHYTNDDQKLNELSSANKHFVLQYAASEKQVHSYAVKQRTLDSYMSEKGIQNDIDFLKIDVEGFELDVLIGAKDLINNNRIKSIQFEINEPNIYQKVFLKDFYEVLTGFTMYRLASDRIIPLGDYTAANEFFSFQNIFATKLKLV